MNETKYNQYKTFNLNKKRPQVLLVGNGLSRQISWKKFIKNVSVRDVEKYYNDKQFQLPNLILASAVTDIDDSARQSKYMEAIEGYKNFVSEQMKDLLSISFDAILTTNYTYELENNLNSNYGSMSNETKRDRYAKTTEGKYDNKYFLHTFNKVIGKHVLQDIWHIHGECRRKSSLILTHDEYAKLMGQIITYNHENKNKFYRYFDNLNFMSWIDYFIMGDLYILGQGFDFSEFDLWWLLLRRLREKAETGKIIFYEPIKEDNKYKLLALKDLGVEINSLGHTIDKSKDENEQYKKFYNEAIKDIYLKVLYNQEEN